MKHRAAPAIHILKRLYLYVPETGVFRHKRDTARGRLGEIAGCLRPDGYIKISVDGEQYLAHQLAWFYVYGEWLPEIDHINRKRSQNWIKNLRPATRAQNNGNSDGWAKDKRKHKLPRGVYHYARCPGRYRSQIEANYKIIHLGCFNSIEEADEAYKLAAIKYFGEFAP